MITVPKNVYYYGRDEDLPDVVPLRAGPLSLVYENGDLRYIRLGAREIVRRIYTAIRDRNWGTVQPRLANVMMDIQPDSFHITYDVACIEGEIDFRWSGAITGAADGTLTFSMDGEARSTFLRNRLGFCILHPIACAGANAQIEHADGAQEASRFPTSIAPQSIRDGQIHPVYPFAEMRALSHEVAPGLWAEVRFEGDIFEMEDQRNWIDASYKTYCTPLRLPFPVQVEKGTKIAQSVTLRLIGDGSSVKDDSVADLSLTVTDTVADTLPRLGLCVASHGRPLTSQEINRLKALNLSYLRADVRLPDDDEALKRADDEARAVGVSLELALHLTDDAENELQAFRQLLEQVRPPVSAWLIFHQKEKSTHEQWLKLARQYLADYDPTAKFGSGTNVFFTELNRERPPAELLDLVVYSINPTVHAIDNASVTETLQAHAPTVESARQFSGHAQIAVSPVTFKMRFNPNATGPQPETPPGELPPQVDARQMSLYGAGWTMGSIKYLAESRVYSATYYETTGWRGVMETEAGSSAPDKFRSIPGGVFPMYHVFADVGEFAGAEALVSKSSQPLTVDGLALRKDGRLRVLLANFTAQTQRVTLHNLRGTLEIKSLDEHNVEYAMRAPENFREQAGRAVEANGAVTLELLPFAVVRGDGYV